jgi:hypothetical protein
MRSKKFAKVILLIFTATALLYNSWPLGYILNYKTARFGLASDLAGKGQPYDWIFILGDVIVGACLIAICGLIRLKLHKELWSRSVAAVVLGVFMFGLFTATSAAAPNTCLHGRISMCARIDKTTFGADGIESTLAAVGLFISLVGINVLGLSRKNLSNKYHRLSQATLVAWPASAAFFLIADSKSSVSDSVHLAQQILMIMTGVALFVIGINIYADLKQNTESVA